MGRGRAALFYRVRVCACSTKHNQSASDSHLCLRAILIVHPLPAHRVLTSKIITVKKILARVARAVLAVRAHGLHSVRAHIRASAQSVGARVAGVCASGE